MLNIIWRFYFCFGYFLLYIGILKIPNMVLAHSFDNSKESEHFNDGLDSLQSHSKFDDQRFTAMLNTGTFQIRRAASCLSSGLIYSHGQKMPRLDSCVECLCMNGEIFCWWENCDRPKASSASYSDTHEPKANIIGNLSTKLNTTQNFMGTLLKLEKNSDNNSDYKSHTEKYKVTYAKHKNYPQDIKKHRNEKYLSKYSKVMKFPENLPSLLYYDYKTKEHEFHQHNHRKQYLPKKSISKIFEKLNAKNKTAHKIQVKTKSNSASHSVIELKANGVPLLLRDLKIFNLNSNRTERTTPDDILYQKLTSTASSIHKTTEEALVDSKLDRTEVDPVSGQEISVTQQVGTNKVSAIKPQDKHCIVMGTLYKVGDIMPQDTGNCLQCVCIDGATRDDAPHVTCSPHNCPPLVLPDLFDVTEF